MQSATVKTSTIFIAKRGQTQVFHSVDDVPAGLRKELEASTNGFNSATILIADRRGREEILRALQGLPSHLRTRITASVSPAASPLPSGSRTTQAPLGRLLRRHWVPLLLPAIAGVLLWLALNFR